MRYEPIDPALFVRNREKLRDLLKPNSIVIVHANDILPTNADGTLLLHQNRDLFYLTGVDQEETVVILFPDAKLERDREILFVRETNEYIAVWEGEKLDKEQAGAVSGIERVEWTNSFETILSSLVPQAEHVYLATNEHLRAMRIVQTRNDRFIKQCQERFPLHRYERLAPLMNELRIIKDEVELSYIQEACDITEKGFRRVLGALQPGMGEWEVEAEYLHEFVRNRSRGFAYSPIIGSGKNACVLHYLENHDVCQDGDMLLMDVGAEYGNWNADMTRTIPVNGRFTPRQRQVYESVLSVLRQANGILRPGITPKDYQHQVRLMMEKELIALGLIGEQEAAEQDRETLPLVSKFFMHGTSHHLGLDVHDVFPHNEPVREGMVFTIEPGIYIPDEKLGVRLENDVLIGRDGNTDLMANIPIEPDDIEALMNA
ncbi:aminopeptidase P N-terminal domain-containing protein [Roseibacillus ishigakijimensis]|uniref:Xaa-Pro aminopeptidase n=1 Tax=Roseibacillus ishigakijimensis TaxID=454146 RepID=A0A934RSN5_9BACT|nr:aminopeptidase P N-terminal domain-containing protein [Roseibacillus ishigakijimensis]MBK1834926.1 aminopeptidase P N-terminal domain-containing protein [Roseibacillus ishigakijimensis]